MWKFIQVEVSWNESASGKQVKWSQQENLITALRLDYIFHRRDLLQKVETNAQLHNTLSEAIMCHDPY